MTDRTRRSVILGGLPGGINAPIVSQKRGVVHFILLFFRKKFFGPQDDLQDFSRQCCKTQAAGHFAPRRVEGRKGWIW